MVESQIKKEYLKLSHGSSNSDCGIVPHHLSTNHCQGLTLSRIDLLKYQLKLLKCMISPHRCKYHLYSFFSHLSLTLTFPGMMEDPGSFSGKDNSPSPQRGPDPK